MERAKFVHMQKNLMKRQLTHLYKQVKDEFHEIDDDLRSYKGKWYAQQSIDFGVLMCLSTRNKLNKDILANLKSLWKWEHVDATTMNKRLDLHNAQLKKIGTTHLKRNVDIYSQICSIITLKAAFLKALYSTV